MAMSRLDRAQLEACWQEGRSEASDTIDQHTQCEKYLAGILPHDAKDKDEAIIALANAHLKALDHIQELEAFKSTTMHDHEQLYLRDYYDSQRGKTPFTQLEETFLARIEQENHTLGAKLEAFGNFLALRTPITQ